MDTQMPVMDGLVAIKNIRQYEIEKGIESSCIISLSANAMVNDKGMALEAGANSYLTKPISKINLVEEIFKMTTQLKS